ncbi:hypothetical protein Taro_003719 [Colocasia esculenta]|uniref:Retrotransposon gag domain-containing protein n=1 Tax=Colocasia esculenta TaxID=4460 RepID=A0A843TPM9_COLES|nr:hypothetical protein [Colocasia esculenta]
MAPPPVFFLLFGDLVNGIGKNQHDLRKMTEEVSKYALYFVYYGLIMCVSSYAVKRSGSRSRGCGGKDVGEAHIWCGVAGLYLEGDGKGCYLLGRRSMDHGRGGAFAGPTLKRNTTPCLALPLIWRAEKIFMVTGRSSPAKREQFRTLQQGNLSVLEYQMRFMVLSRCLRRFSGLCGPAVRAQSTCWFTVCERNRAGRLDLNVMALGVAFWLPLFEVFVCMSAACRAPGGLADVDCRKATASMSRSCRDSRLRRVPNYDVFLLEVGRTELRKLCSSREEVLRWRLGRSDILGSFSAWSCREDVARSGETPGHRRSLRSSRR